MFRQMTICPVYRVRKNYNTKIYCNHWLHGGEVLLKIYQLLGWYSPHFYEKLDPDHSSDPNVSSLQPPVLFV